MSTSTPRTNASSSNVCALPEQGRALPVTALLIPEVVELEEVACDRLEEASGKLAEFGLALERFGPNAMLVRAIPAALAKGDPAKLVADVADDLAQNGDALLLGEKLDLVLATMACHGSVRAGARAFGGGDECAFARDGGYSRSGQCNHGRPTWVKLAHGDIEKLFGGSEMARLAIIPLILLTLSACSAEREPSDAEGGRGSRGGAGWQASG